MNVSRERRKDIFDRIYRMDGIIWLDLMSGQILHPLRGMKLSSCQVQIPADRRMLPRVQKCSGVGKRLRNKVRQARLGWDPQNRRGGLV